MSDAAKINVLEILLAIAALALVIVCRTTSTVRERAAFLEGRYNLDNKSAALFAAESEK